MKVSLKYIVQDMDRHGNVRLYFRRKGQPKVRIRAPVGSPEFLAAYRAAEAGPVRVKKTPGLLPIKPQSLRWLCVQYFQSPEYRRLEPRTQTIRRRFLERLCDQRDTKGAKNGDKPYALLEPRHVRKWRDEKQATPAEADNLVKAIRVLFSFAIEHDLHDRNPVLGVKNINRNSKGIHCWTEEEIARFVAAHAFGSQARLALALGLYTTQRRSDLVQLGRQHIKDGYFHLTQHKNRNIKPVRLQIWIHPELQRVIDATPASGMTLLETAFGKPFTSAGFGNRFKSWCQEAGLPDRCSVHGLRKAGATRLANSGASDHDIMAVTGHTTVKQLHGYTREADRKVGAERALKGLSDS
jgi:integrase